MTDAFPPELAVVRWFNTPSPLTLATFRGRVVVLHAFQMLCPGCVSHALPQAERLHRMFGGAGVAVVGLHTVFEHHAAMTPVALEAFIHEYRLTFPIGVDEPGTDGPLPVTMARYGMRGTPTTRCWRKRPGRPGRQQPMKRMQAAARPAARSRPGRGRVGRSFPPSPTSRAPRLTSLRRGEGLRGRHQMPMSEIPGETAPASPSPYGQGRRVWRCPHP
jgi:peroxiredoxin